MLTNEQLLGAARHILEWKLPSNDIKVSVHLENGSIVVCMSRAAGPIATAELIARTTSVPSRKAITELMDLLFRELEQNTGPSLTPQVPSFSVAPVGGRKR